MKKVALVFALMTLLAAAASAGVCTPRIHARAWRQERRIGAGLRSGELTRHEALRLERGQLRIHRMERLARLDGRVGPRERFGLNRALDRQSRRIWRLEHNSRVM